jgi:predicted nucleic acid-binding protein
MTVVSNTSPLNYLILIGQEHLLPALFDRVVTAPAVIGELLHPGTPDQVKVWAASPPSWLEIVSPVKIDPTLDLGAGEIEAISVALQLKPDLMIIDERKASTAALRLGLKVTGTLGVLDVAAKKRLLDLPQAFAALRETTFRGPEILMEELLKQDTLRRKAASN